jgi:4-amino-4-deoxy-L-arabinose transferase-like glycosyltransferase
LRRFLVLLFLAAALLRSRGIEEPWKYDSHDGWGGAFYSNIARNYLRYGYLETRLAPVVNTGDTPPEERRYYLTHPPLIGLAVSVSFRLLGEREWAARLVPLLFGLGSLLLVVRIGSRLWSREVGLLAGGIYAFVPMEAAYASHVDPQGAPVTFFSLSLLLAYIEKRPAFAFGALLLGAGFDWPVHYMAGLLGFHALLLARERRRWALLLPAGSVVLAIGFLFYARTVAPRPEQLYLGSTPWESFLFWSGIEVTRGHIPGHRMEAPGARRWLSREASYFRELFGVPLGLLAALGFATSGRRGSSDLLALLSIWGALHVLLFPMGAFVHDYWMVYLSPGLALAGALGILAIADRVVRRDASPRLRAPFLAGTGALLAVGLVFQGLSRSEPPDSPSLGKKLREISAPSEVILALTPLDARDAYYADRRIEDGVNSIARFEKIAKKEDRLRWFVVPRSIYEARPQKPLFASLARCCARLAYADYLLFDLTMKPRSN